GRREYVQFVNLLMAVYDKATGNRVFGPVAGNSIWNGFGGICEENNDGDPVVVLLADAAEAVQAAVAGDGPEDAIAGRLVVDGHQQVHELHVLAAPDVSLRVGRDDAEAGEPGVVVVGDALAREQRRRRCAAARRGLPQPIGAGV